jgi:hypothetical protein
MVKQMNRELFQQFLDDLPQLHTWDNGKTWNSGGFGPFHLKGIADVLTLLPGGFNVIETGAGNSTLSFLLLGAQSVVAIAPDQALFDRIYEAAEKRLIDCGPLKPIVAFSEDILPALAAESKLNGVTYDFALIDGGHGWPTVFVDFCYIMAILKPGGYLMIDDIQLFSVKQLARLLNESEEFSLVSSLQKSLIFRKDTKNMRMRDFGAQPYIKRMTEAERSAGKPFVLEC